MFLFTLLSNSPDISLFSFHATWLIIPSSAVGPSWGGCTYVNFAYHSSSKPFLSLSSNANSKLQFFYPPREGATAQDGISDIMWREEKDMSGQLLTKVKRQNKIMIEFKGTSSITRAD